jgi:hypothetical protein
VESADLAEMAETADNPSVEMPETVEQADLAETVEQQKDLTHKEE